MEEEQVVEERRPRYWIAVVVGLIAMALVVGQLWWQWNRMLQMFEPGGGSLPLPFRDLSGKPVTFPSSLSLFPTWSLYYMATASYGVLLVLAGRRKTFWLPLFLMSAYSTFWAMGAWVNAAAEPAWLLQALAAILGSLGVYLAPSIALLFVAPKISIPPRPSSTGKVYLGLVTLLAALLSIGLWLIADRHNTHAPQDVWIVNTPGPLLGLLAAKLGLVIFGAGIALRRRWLAAVPVALAAAAFFVDPLPWETRRVLPYLITRALANLAVIFAATAWPSVERWVDAWIHHWKPGDEVVLRERRDGGIWAARPAIVAKDTIVEQSFYIPIGAKWWYPADDNGNEMRLPLEDWRLAEGTMNTRHILSFAWRRKPYAVLLAWDPDWNFTGYYINLQTPLERKESGFDYVEHVLDIEMSPDKQNWNWKDEEDLQRMVDEGLFTQEQAEDFRKWGDTAVEHILFETPFDEDWSEWRPSPDWPFPELPPDWDELD